MTENFRLDTKVTTKKRVNPVKLIAETQEESSKLNGLSALLLDLGIDVDSYENEEAIAVSFWNAHDHMPVPERLAAMSELDRAAFLYSIEDQLRAAMLAAGYRAIEQALDRAQLGKVPARNRPEPYE